VDYGLVVYGAACNTRMEKIDVALRSSLRTILGATKSTPTASLYAELGLEPVMFRRKWLAARYAIRCSRRPKNAAFASSRQVAQHPEVWPRLKTPALAEIIDDINDVSIRFLCTEPDVQPQFRSPPPWAPPSVDTLWFPMSKAQAVANKQEARRRVQALLDLQSSSTAIFTDGAHHEDSDRTACAVFCPALGVEQAWRLQAGSSIFTAEVLGIKKALDLVYERDEELPDVMVFIDSQAAIRALSSPSVEPEESVWSTLNTIQNLKASGTRVTLVWIPSHVGIPGNERVDTLASNACQDLSTTVIPLSLSTSEQFSLYKRGWKTELWNHLNQKNRMTVSFRDSPGRVPWQFVKERQMCVTLHKLRSGHNRLNASRRWLDEERDPSCRFCESAEEDVNHIIIQCPHLEQYRLKFKEQCQKISVNFELKTVLGCNKEVSRTNQFKIRDALCVFVHRAGLVSIV